jgi:hypothetical protein
MPIGTCVCGYQVVSVYSRGATGTRLCEADVPGPASPGRPAESPANGGPPKWLGARCGDGVDAHQARVPPPGPRPTTTRTWIQGRFHHRSPSLCPVPCLCSSLSPGQHHHLALSQGGSYSQGSSSQQVGSWPFFSQNAPRPPGELPCRFPPAPQEQPRPTLQTVPRPPAGVRRTARRGRMTAAGKSGLGSLGTSSCAGRRGVIDRRLAFYVTGFTDTLLAYVQFLRLHSR